jgi:hypothetical protein
MLKRFKRSEKNKLVKWLNESDIATDGSHLNKHNTYLLKDSDIIGFFTFRIEHNLPSLRHFYVNKNYRSMYNARRLLNEYKNLIKKLGFNKTIISTNKEYLQKFIEYYFKSKPYSFVEGLYFYYVEV